MNMSEQNAAQLTHSLRGQKTKTFRQVLCKISIADLNKQPHKCLAC